jgi:hypothetical protein
MRSFAGVRNVKFQMKRRDSQINIEMVAEVL